MPAPTKLEIATKAVIRLVKEEKSYHKELVNQLARLEKRKEEAKTTAEDDNAHYLLKQEETAIAETRAMFEPLGLKIAAAVEKLIAEQEAAKDTASEEFLKAAEDAIQQGKEVMAKAAQDVKIVSA